MGGGVAHLRGEKRKKKKKEGGRLSFSKSKIPLEECRTATSVEFFPLPDHRKSMGEGKGKQLKKNVENE